MGQFVQAVRLGYIRISCLWLKPHVDDEGSSPGDSGRVFHEHGGWDGGRGCNLVGTGVEVKGQVEDDVGGRRSKRGFVGVGTP